MNIVLIPIVILLFVIRVLFKIQFVRIRDSRIGHLAMNTEIFLRKVQLGIIKTKSVKYVGIASTAPANKQILKMFKRVFPIISIPQPKYVRALVSKVSKYSILNKTGLFAELPPRVTSYNEFNRAKPNVKFTSKEEEKGGELLRNMGVGDSWFICFHARDSAYLDKKWGTGDSYHNFRNCDINTYLKTAQHITEKGGYAIRIGYHVKDKLKDTKNEKIIDYATKHRSDFGDIYLSAKCKFFVGDGCGINQIAQIFDVPVAYVNLATIEYPPLNKKSLFIPKKVWSTKEKRFLSYKEILNNKRIVKCFNAYEHDKIGIKVVDNTEEEILDLVSELNARLDGTWETTKEDEELQKKLKDILNQSDICNGFPSRMGTKFLRNNKWIIK